MVTSARMKMQLKGKKIVLKKNIVNFSRPAPVTANKVEDKLDRIISNFRKSNGGIRRMA